VSLALLWVGRALAGAPPPPPLATCPRSIDVQESLPSPEGFTAAATHVAHAFDGVTLFDGPPAELASLVPDDEKSKGSHLTQTWRFPSPREHPLFLVCRYADTSATLTRELPAAVTTCSISLEWSEKGGVLEHPAVPPGFACR
jgi:hypothetical protein